MDRARQRHHGRRSQRRRLPPRAGGGRDLSQANPFKGLAYYERSDEGRFGGRDKDVPAVLSGILKARIFVLYGRSGQGKTSLLLAGILPRLEEHECRPVYVRALVDPLADLRAAVLAQLGGEDSDTFHSLVDRVDDGPVVIVFDQFEEFFIRFADHATAGSGDARDEELGSEERRLRRWRRERFIREIGELAAADLNLRLVFSLREDWIAQMQDFSEAIPNVGDNGYRLLPLTAFGVRDSIKQTLRTSGVAFDTRLVSALVENLAEVSFDPAVLQVVCSEVWSAARQRTAATGPETPVRLTFDDLEQVGGVQGIFEDYLDQVTRRIPESNLRMRLQTRAVLESAITSECTKRAESKEFFLSRYFAIAPEELDRVMDLLVEHRLMRRERRADGDWFELMHERLIDTILRWLDEDLDFFKFRAARNLLRNSCANKGWHENPGLLLSQEQLDGTIGPFKELLRFDEEERLFLVSSATYGRSKDLEFWAELAGYGTSAELLERLLADDNVTIRLRAAEAAGRIDDAYARFAGTCLDLATTDPEEEVRRVAGRSFAHLASREHFAELAARIGKRRTRARALAVLDDAYEEGKLPRDGTFSRLQVRRAYERVFKRRLHRSRDAIRARGKRGALTGLLAGLLWTATGVPLLILSMHGQISLSELAMATPVVALASVLLGWRAAVRAAEQAMSSGEEGRVFRAMSGWILRTLLGAPLFFILAFLAYSFASGWQAHLRANFVSTAFPFTVGLACTLTWAWLASIARPICWPGIGGWRAWLGAWLGGVATSLACAFAGDAAFSEHLFSRVVAGSWSQLAPEFLRAMLALGAAMGGGVVCVGLLAVARSSPGWAGLNTPELGSLPPVPPRWTRLLIVAAVAGASLFAIRISSADRETGYPHLSHLTQFLPLFDVSINVFHTRAEGRPVPVATAQPPQQAHAEAATSTGDRTPSDAELDRKLVIEELLVTWDLELLRLEQRLEDLTLTADEERSLRADLERVTAEREQAMRQAERDIDTGRIDVDEVMARSPHLRALRAERRPEPAEKEARNP